MDVSLVICTRNRADRLARTLDAVAQLAFAGPWEAVLVDNGSTDGTDQALARFAEGSGLNVTLLHEPRPGLSHARNAGWRGARGAIVAFTDDDCYPAADFLAETVRCFAEADVAFVGGRVLLYDNEDLPVTIQLLERRVPVPAASYVRSGLIHGANFAFRRAVLECIGGFDPLLGAGAPLHSSEDWDALIRAIAAVFAGAYDPGPVVFHHHGRRSVAEMKRVKAGYDIGRGAVYAKGLMDARTRVRFVKVIAHRLAGHLVQRRFEILGREVRGARRYLALTAMNRGRLT